jgi:hypothetical protein
MWDQGISAFRKTPPTKPHRHLWAADCLEYVRASTSQSPMGLHSLLQGIALPLFRWTVFATNLLLMRWVNINSGVERYSELQMCAGQQQPSVWIARLVWIQWRMFADMLPIVLARTIHSLADVILNFSLAVQQTRRWRKRNSTSPNAQFTVSLSLSLSLCRNLVFTGLICTCICIHTIL